MMIHMNMILRYAFSIVTSLVLLTCCDGKHSQEKDNMCEKLPMQADGIVRLSKIQVNPEYLDEYMKYAINREAE